MKLQETETREAVKLRHDKHVACAHGGEGLGETGAVAVRAGQTVICVDAVFGDPKLCKGSTLRRQILTIGGAAGCRLLR